MALESDFLQMSTQTINVHALSTMGAYGEPIHSTSPSTFFAYIEPGTRLVLDSQGIQQVASAMIYVISSSASIGMQDRLTLWDGRVPKMLRVDVLNDEEGQHHVEIGID